MPLTLKRIYKQYTEYNYDFRGKSVATMEADGWVFLHSNYAKFDNTNWMGSTTQDKTPFPKIWDLTSIMPTANKVTISMTCANVNRFRCGVWLYNTVSDSSVWQTWPYATAAENRIIAYIYWTENKTSMTISWTITATMVVDLQNWTWTASATNGYSNSWTLSAADISNIRNNTTCIGVNPSRWGWWNSTWWILTMNVLIE